jgi:hypothetical protein
MLTLTVLSGNVFAQTFQKALGESNDIDMVIVTKDMFDLITEIDSDKKHEMKSFYGKLNFLESYTTINSGAARLINSEVKKYIRSKGMKLLTKIKDQQKNAELYYVPAEEKGYAEELLIIINYASGKTSLLFVKGHINMRRISLLALQSTGLDRSLLKQAEQSVK